MRPRTSLPRWLGLIPVLLLAAWLGARGLDASAIWIDEYWTIYNAGGAHYGPLSVGGILDRIAEEDIWHVPLYYLLMAGWGSLVGWSPAALRAFSWLVGLLSVALTYRLGRDLHSPRAGLAGAVTLGASAYYLYYFHELRSYTLNVLLAALVIWAYWRALNAREGAAWRWVALLFVAALLTVYTHYLAALALAALGIYHLAVAPKNRRWWAITGAALAAGALFLPWLGVTLRAWAEASSPENVALRDWGPGALELNALLLTIYGNGALALPLLFGWFAVRARPTPPAVRFGGFLLIAWLALAFVLNSLIALFVVLRYLLPLFPVLALLAGIGIASVHRRWYAPALVAWALAGAVASLDGGLARSTLDTRLLSPPWHTVARGLEARAMPGDHLVLLLPEQTWYVWQDWTSGFHFHALQTRQNVTLSLVESYPHLTDRDYRQAARGILAPRVWVGRDPARPPTAWYRFRDLLPASYADCDAPLVVAGYRLDLYARRPDQPALMFDGRAGVALVERLHVADDTLSVVVGWSLGEGIEPRDYSAGLHLHDADDRLIAQIDGGLPVEPFTCSAHRFDLAGLPAGELALYAVIYDWRTGERLPVDATRDRLLLGRITR